MKGIHLKYVRLTVLKVFKIELRGTSNTITLNMANKPV